MSRLTCSMLAFVSAIAIGTSMADAKPGGGRGNPGGAHAWSGTPPGFSQGVKRGWVNGRPPGWSKGKRKGWGTRSTPPGWRNR